MSYELYFDLGYNLYSGYLSGLIFSWTLKIRCRINVKKSVLYEQIISDNTFCVETSTATQDLQET